jgi:glyoxylase-like metal-dependent hydrolase (beta-lactamase superfamily II)
MTTTTPTINDLPTVDDHHSEITGPTVFRPYEVTTDIHVIPSYLPVPGMGVLPANAFLIDGPEPVLVDSGPGTTQESFAAALASVIDPTSIRWLWLTHTDPDHTGSLEWLLEVAPNMQVITTYLAVGKMSMSSPLPMDRLYWCSPGETVPVAGHPLVALTPPSFDAPETTGCFDPATGTLFSADSFGALSHQTTTDAREIPSTDLGEGMVLWSTVDSPWLQRVDRAAFDRSLEDIRELSPRHILSSHLPPATDLTDELLGHLAHAPDANPWVGPNQAALEAILTQTQG